MSPNLETELATAMRLAQEGAHKALMVQLSGQLGTQTKADKSPVTVADLAVNELIVSALRRTFPSDAVLAEESTGESDRRWADRCWMVDPIDGTRSYSEGGDHWAVQIGLVIEGRPVLGVVGERDRLTWGIVGRGAWTQTRDGRERLTVQPRSLERLVQSAHSPMPMKQAAILGPDGHRGMGSVGVKIGFMLRGGAEVYCRPGGGTKLWDSAGPEAILTAAGGTMTDVDGGTLNYAGKSIRNARGILATVGLDHAKVVAKSTNLFRGKSE